ncbi:MAG TPA: serine/threonine-protein kinase [Polyangiaceae bacterium]|jgi:serine/threonine-protein kinase|nr:serine/threonine-protein kinase [Polyangiaceae bacterium]
MTSEATALNKEGLPAIGEVIAQKYRVESVVGAGGMGVVVAARHLQLGQTVAIKLLLAPEESRRAEANTRFIREAQAAATLHSDHVVRIYDVGMLDSGLPFMVMELLRGSDLGTLLDTQGTLTEVQAVDFVLQACDAISEAHQAGIVHRDLKPSNLFITQRSDGSPLLKVLDFGISKSLTAGEGAVGELTSTRAVMGSPYYMSPEQVRDARRVDARTDIWALGVILQELLTGEPAFQADTFPGVCAAIVADQPVGLRHRRPDVSPELEAVVLRCLEKDQTRRFQSVTEFIQALLPFSSRAITASGRYMRSLVPGIGFSSHPAAGVSTAPARHSRPATGDDETLSQSDTGRGSARSGRVITGDTRTQLSADLMTAPTLPAPAIPAKKRWLAIAAGAAVLTFAGLSAFSFLVKRADTQPPPQLSSAASATPASSEAFTLIITSLPTGAEVFEGQKRLGDTPLTLTVTIPADAAKSRVFSLRKAGYKPYVVEQGPAHGEVHLQAALVADEPSPSSLSANAAESAVPQVVPRRPAQRSAPAHKSAAAAAAPPPASDIRLQR